MNTAIANTVTSTDQISKYDNAAKKLLSQKIILAHLLVKTVDEFSGMEPEEVVDYIEGEIYVEKVPVEPGMTNYPIADDETSDASTDSDVNGDAAESDMPLKKAGALVVGLNTEQSEIQEGVIYYDILFYVRLKNGLSRMMVNIEPQKSMPTKYGIVNRATFYVSRMISSQKEREFVKDYYDDIKKVFSIWICMDMNENVISHIHMIQEDVINSYQWEGDLDLMNIVMIGLTKELPQFNDEYGLHRLIGTVLTDKLSPKEKLEILKNEYDIPIEESLDKEVQEVGSLGQGIYDEAKEEGKKEGRAEGREEGIKEGIKEGREEGREETTLNHVLNMHKDNMPINKIAEYVSKSIEEVKAIIEAGSMTTA